MIYCRSMITPESAFGPACFPAAEFSAAFTPETIETDWGRFAANVFVRVSRQTPPSVVAQGAEIALVTREENIPSPEDLTLAFRADRLLAFQVADIVNNAYGQDRSRGETVTASHVDNLIFSVFHMAKRLNCLLTPSEIKAVGRYHGTLVGDQNEISERIHLDGKLDTLARFRADGIARPAGASVDWLLDSSNDADF